MKTHNASIPKKRNCILKSSMFSCFFIILNFQTIEVFQFLIKNNLFYDFAESTFDFFIHRFSNLEALFFDFLCSNIVYFSSKDQDRFQIFLNKWFPLLIPKIAEKLRVFPNEYLEFIERNKQKLHEIDKILIWKLNILIQHFPNYVNLLVRRTH